MKLYKISTLEILSGFQSGEENRLKQVQQHSQFNPYTLTKILKEKKMKADQTTQTDILWNRQRNGLRISLLRGLKCT